MTFKSVFFFFKLNFMHTQHLVLHNLITNLRIMYIVNYMRLLDFGIIEIA